MIVVAGVIVVMLAQLGTVADDAARARTAADAAALAGALGGRSEAARLAEANGALLETFDVAGPTVEVVVRVGAVSARARALRSTEWDPP